jgi:hypothetical protein
LHDSFSLCESLAGGSCSGLRKNHVHCC